jgi:3'-phosphoadenosine 5'-phosphosulfate sulfotransferase (PAPS reductase)/FAD synthetase
MHIVQYSGGIGSFMAARRVIDEHGPAGVLLLFADTRVEDPDLYRFLDESAAALGVELVRVCDGRTPFEVFDDVSFLGNSRLAPCSHHLKQKPCRKWLEANRDPADTILYVGIDWSERRRCASIERNWAPWRVEFPMCDEPHLTKAEMIEACRDAKVTPPRLYDLGFAHNNCGGVCVRAGQGQWRHLLATFPERFAEAEAREATLRARLGDVAILKRTRNHVAAPLPLAQLRRECEAAS